MLEPGVCWRSSRLHPRSFMFPFTWVLHFGFHSVSLLCHPPVAAVPPILISK